ncbi:Bug family tripartite tricarboxylate transporter substrate binding protein [Agaricicola taiwanensis]|nr:tripartite tricarboxylate transporter substrate binding protein [Agaricicola taiwanensis]
MKMLRLAATLLTGALIAGATPARAEFPEGPIRLIVPFAPGGTTDVVARRIAPKVGELLGQSVIIDNRGGGGGSIAAQATATAEPDGYTLMMTTTSHTANPSVQMNLPYDTLKDFVSVALVADQPGVIVVHPSVPVNSFKELMEYAKTHKLTYATAGPGTFPHLGIELLKSRAGVDMSAIPYKGAGPAMTDLLAGHVKLKLDAYITAYSHVKAGKLKLLAVSSPERIPQLPDTPTVAELGYPGYEVSFWMGIVGPTGIPEPVRAKLEKAFTDALTPEIRAVLEKDGVRPIGGSGKDLDALIQREIPQWAKLVKDANITAN